MEFSEMNMLFVRCVQTHASVLCVCVQALCFRNARLQPQTLRNPEVAVVTNTLPCAGYFSWHVNTLITNTNTVHIRIYLPRGKDSEKTSEETIGDQNQQTVAQRDCLSASSCSQKLKFLNILSPYHVF